MYIDNINEIDTTEFRDEIREIGNEIRDVGDEIHISNLLKMYELKLLTKEEILEEINKMGMI